MMSLVRQISDKYKQNQDIKKISVYTHLLLQSSCHVYLQAATLRTEYSSA